MHVLCIAGHAMSVDICSSSSSKQPTPKSREGNSSSSSSSSPPSSKPRHDPSISTAALAPSTSIDMDSPSRRPVRPGWSSADSGRVSQGSANQMTANTASQQNSIQTDMVSGGGSVVVGTSFSNPQTAGSKLERTSRSSEDSPMVVLQHPTTVTSH